MRRSFFILLLAALIVFGVYRYYHLATTAPGHRRLPERYTPAQGSKIDLKDIQVLAALDAEYSKLIGAVVPSVVSINSSRTVRFQQRPLIRDPLDLFFPNRNRLLEREQNSLGSGVIVSREGHILTNNHVIANMEKIEVQLTDGRSEPATLIGSDEQTDIAVLKIDARNLEPLPFGDSDQVRVGQMVFAIGNPFGLQETVTQGIVSAKGRRAVNDSAVEFLQTDAAVNQGNSGGPLLNLRGEIVGINSAIYSNSEAGNWLGISFAIPANTARRTLESLLKNGRVLRGYLGVEMQNLTPTAARGLGLPDTTGAKVMGVAPGSPAEKAGLKPGDVIRSFNGRPIADYLALRSRVADTDLNAQVELGVWRDGKLVKIPATILEVPADLGLAQSPSGQPKPATPREPVAPHSLASVEVGPMPAALRDALPPEVEGVVITQLQPDSPAADKLRVGDVIEEINRRPIRSVEDFERAVRTLSQGDKALLLVCRGRSRAFVVVP
ncbi:MAG: serine protease Do [Chthoniobacter sp.]|jgi:serine protease Do|nr:serine protease Do [Chthoniobacter sp.]